MNDEERGKPQLCLTSRRKRREKMPFNSWNWYRAVGTGNDHKCWIGDNPQVQSTDLAHNNLQSRLVSATGPRYQNSSLGLVPHINNGYWDYSQRPISNNWDQMTSRLT